jgi:hypothetical protein
VFLVWMMTGIPTHRVSCLDDDWAVLPVHFKFIGSLGVPFGAQICGVSSSVVTLVVNVRCFIVSLGKLDFGFFVGDSVASAARLTDHTGALLPRWCTAATLAHCCHATDGARWDTGVVDQLRQVRRCCGAVGFVPDLCFVHFPRRLCSGS